MKILVSNKIKVQDYTQEMLDYCKSKLVLPNPEFYKKQAQGRWIGNTQREFVLYERVGNDLLLPFGCFKQLWDMFGGKIDFESRIHPIEPRNYASHINLYPYQEQAVQRLLKAKNGVLVSPCGSGKTQMALETIARIGGKTLWLTHTGELLTQSMDRAKSCFDLPSNAYGTITAGKVNIGTAITFATVQTMCNIDLQQYAREWDVIVVDECFPAGTKILTPNGEKELQCLKVGDIITSYNRNTGNTENKPILNLFKHKAKRIVKVKLSNKKEIICTSNHPFFTKDREWVSAGCLRSDDYVMFLLRQGNRRNEIVEHDEVSQPKKRLGLLQSRVLEKRRSGKVLDERRSENENRKKAVGIQQGAPCGNFQKNEITKSDEKSRNEAKSFKKAKRNRALPENKVRKRYRAHCATAGLYACACKVQGSLRRIPYTDKNKAWKRLSDLLQGRHCHCGRNGCHRNRRLLSLRDRKAKPRQEENGLSEWVRVESVEICQQTSDGTFGGLCKDGFVYNIEVADNNNYFVDGVLVHNCHKAIGSPTKIMQFYKVLSNLSARYKIGVTATPKRSDGLERCMFALLGDIVHTIPKEEVAKFTCPVFVKKVETGYVPNLDFVLAGDGTIIYSDLLKDLTGNTKRNEKIAEDIKAIVSQENNARILVLSDRVEHLSTLRELLSGYRVKQLMALSNSGKARAERRQILKDLNNGELNVVLATYALAKEGLDVPKLDYVVFASPQKDDTTVTQAAGRVGRKAEGKEYGTVIDYTDSGFGMLAGFSRKRNSIYKKLEYKIV